MRILLVGGLAVALFCGVASAQVAGGTRADVRGQVFLPNGSPAEMILRVQLTGEDGQRPPEYFFTDSKGRFGIRDLMQGGRYIFTVESDGKNWGASTELIYIPQGTQPFVTLHLKPLLISPLPDRPSISATELNQTVPPNAKREYEYAVASLAAGDLDRAGKQFERALKMFPDFVEARSELAVVRMRQGELAAAETLLRRALEIDSAAVRPLLNLGLCLYRQQRFADALPFIERGVQLQPDNANGNLLLGITLFSTGDDARSEGFLRKAYEQAGARVARAQLYLSRLYALQKKYDLAAQALEIYLRDLPSDPDATELQVTLGKLRAAARP
jgi:tetratricopeptide (TPR) repeat protein